MSKQTIGGGTTPPFPQAARAGDVEAILAEAGCTMTDVVRCTCWIDDPRDFGRSNAVYASYFGDDPPARSTVLTQLMPDGRLEDGGDRPQAGMSVSRP